MKRTTATFGVNDINSFKQKMLNWANRFNIFLFLDSHSYQDKHSNEEWILAAGVINEFRATKNVLPQFKTFLSENQDWLFGHFSYDLKNEIHPLTSSHPDGIRFPDIYFFVPDVLIRKNGDEVEISSITSSPENIFLEIESTAFSSNGAVQSIEIKQRILKEEYLHIIQQLKQHILQGDCYEINFCQEFFAEYALIDPLLLYQKLSAISPTPFGGFYKLNDKYLLCASPERFLLKKGNKIISQPIKGTTKRNLNNAAADEQLKKALQNSQKDKSENVMVVDLVRNDLSRICTEGSVRVEELYGIYSFPQVHQMISTISGELNNNIDLADVLKATFPMGSMTGAPKMRVMELIEQYEKTKRGIYSGSIGYITPEKDFDFNVVIRSIMYDQDSQYLSYQVGGGITFYSDLENEYEECLLKAAAIKKVLQ